MSLSRKILAALTSLTLITMMAGPVGFVKADDQPTVAQLQAQIASLKATIDQLTSLIASLQSGKTGTTPTTPSGTLSGIPSDFTFQKNLKLGSKGDDVKYLQIVLNSDPDTQLVASGVGSAGHETSYFGPLTKAAVIKFQDKYASDVLAPIGLTKGTGFVGAKTRAKLNELLAAGTTQPVPPAVLSVSSVTPESDATNVPVNTEISATFSEALDTSTVTTDSVYVTDKDGKAVDGTVTYNADDKKVVFTPSADLAYSTTYTVTLTTAIKSESGTPLADNASWSFTTEAKPFTGLEIALGDNTPAGRGVAYNEPGVVYATLKATASKEDVAITGLTVKREGLGRYNDFSKVYAVVDGVRHGSKRILGSDDTAELSFPGLYSKITIPKGTSKDIEIVADMNASSGGTIFAGDVNSLAVTAIDTTSKIDGTLPIVGKTFSVTSLSAPTADFTYEGDTSDITVGTTQATVGEFKLENTSSADIVFKSLTLKQTGTADKSDVTNYTLYNADTDKAIAPAVDANDSDQIIFTLDNPITITDGDSLNLAVKADVTDGADKTLTLALDEPSDLVANGTSNGFLVIVTPSGSANTHNLVAGDVTLTEDANNPSAQTVAPDTKGVTFLKADLTAQKTPIIVTSLRVDIAHNGVGTADNTDLKNIDLYSGDQRVGGPLDYDASTGYVTFNEDFQVDDTAVLTVKADVSKDVEAGEIYTMSIDSDNMTAERLDGTAVDASKISGTADGKAVTIATGTLTLAKASNYGNQSVVAGTKGAKIASYVLQAGSAEDIKIKKYTVDLAVSGMTINDVSNLKIGDTTVSTPKTTGNSFTVGTTLAANQTQVVDVYADLASGITAGATIQATLTADVEGVSSSAESTPSEPGQVITIAQSSLAVAVSSSTPTSDIILASSDDVPLATYTFSATNEEYNVTEMKVAVTNTDYARDFNDVYLKWGDSSSAKLPLVNGVAYFTGLSIPVPKDDKADVSVYADLNQIASGAAVSGDQPAFQLTYYKAESATRTITDDSVKGPDTPAVPATGTITISAPVDTLDHDITIDGTTITLPEGATTSEIASDIAAASFTDVIASANGSDVTFTAKTPGDAGNSIFPKTGDDNTYSGGPIPAITLAGGADAIAQVDTVTPTANATTADAVYNIQINDGNLVKTFTVNESEHTTVTDIVNTFVSAINGTSLAVTASNDSDTLKITADNAGTAGEFTTSVWVSGTNTDNDTLTLAHTTTAADAVPATDTITISAPVTTLDHDITIDGTTITLPEGATTSDIASDIAAASFTDVTASASGSNVTFTAKTPGDAANGTLAMTDDTYSGGTIPAITLAGGADLIPGGDIVSNDMTLRKTEPVVKVVDASGNAVSGDTYAASLTNGTVKIFGFQIASANDNDVTLSGLTLTATASSGVTIASPKLYDSANNLVADGTYNSGTITFTGLSEDISTAKDYYVKADVSGATTGSSLSTQFKGDNSALTWSDGSATGIDASLLTVPTTPWALTY